MKRILNDFKNISHWLYIGKFHIIWILLVLITLGYLFHLINFYPNYISLILSVSGLWIILKQQMIDVQEFARYKPNTFGNWIRSFPCRKSATIYQSPAGAVAFEGNLNVRVSISNDASMERKIDYLLDQTNNLMNSISNIEAKINSLQSDIDINKDNSTLRTELTKLDKTLSRLIAGHAVGTYDLTLLGIVATLCGSLIQFFRA